jgi:zinc D-Ala-D-Ala dipeptidase
MSGTKYPLFNNFKTLIITSFCISAICLMVSCNNAKENESWAETAKELPEEIKLPISEYETSMINQGLVNLKSLDSTLIVDLKYSTEDNFFGQDVYGTFANAYMQKDPANALVLANKNLKQTNPNLRLVIYDAARPHRIQQILWDKLDSIPTKRRKDFVADPEEGSIHNYGCAVDLSVFDLTQNQALDMGTKYDYFGDLAYPRLEEKLLSEGELTLEQVENRKILRNAMEKAGYQPISSEWWHFNFYSRKTAKAKYEIVD